jgi:hypothetical protein
MSRLTDMDTGFLDDDKQMEVKLKKKPAARKSRKAPQAVEDGVLADFESVLSSADHEGVTDASKSLVSINPENTLSREGTDPMPASAQREKSPKLRELDFNRVSVRSRSGPPKSAQMPTVFTTSDDVFKPLVATLSAEWSSTTAEDCRHQVSVASAITYPTPDASVQDELEEIALPSNPMEERAGFDTILESEGFTMIDLESLPSARQFVPSPDNFDRQETHASADNGTLANSPQQGSISYPTLAPLSSRTISSSSTDLSRTGKPPPTSIPSYLAPPEEGESDLSSTVPSSPPVEFVQRDFINGSAPLARSPLRQAHTPPRTAKSSPKLPSPPNQSQKANRLVTNEKAKRTPPRLARVVRAGIALQGLLSPKATAPSLEPSPITKISNMGKRNALTPKERLDNLFVGFDSGTRRELRAGLRFGEELAKRQRLSSPEPSISEELAQAAVVQQNCHEKDKIWRGETGVEHTPLRCENNEARPPKSPRDTKVLDSEDALAAQTPATHFDGNKSCESIYYLDSEARERRWQLERKAVSRQIEDANTSQVIVIDSDDEDDNGEASTEAPATQPSPVKSGMTDADEDIWLAEAEEAQNSSRHMEADLFPPAEQVRQHEKAKEAISKPRRSLIPSPWKRGEDVDSTLLTNGDLSGIFWQRPKDARSLSSQPPPSSNTTSAEEPKRSFDVDKMLGASSARHEQTSATTESVLCPGAEDRLEHGEEQESLFEREPEYAERDEEMEKEEHLESEPESEARSRIDEETQEDTSIMPETVRVPVNFNDTTETSFQSDAGMGDNTELESPASSPSCPVAPRSALKGSRASLNIIDESASPTPRKVVFSRRSFCLDEGGMETSMRVRSGSFGSQSSLVSDDLHDAEVQDSKTVTAQKGKGGKGNEDERSSAGASRQPALVFWFRRLTGWGLKPAPTTCPAPASEGVIQQPPQESSMTSHAEENAQWEPTTTVLPTTSSQTSNNCPAQSDGSSDAPDPRIPPPPESLPTSGYFSDNHYKHLHILYLKSLTPNFTRPDSIRPGLKKCIRQKVYSGDGEFAWEITRRDAEVVERWIRSFEGRDARERVENWENKKQKYRKIEWDEWDLCKRLYSIVAGQEVRREQREKKEKQMVKKGW